MILKWNNGQKTDLTFEKRTLNIRRGVPPQEPHPPGTPLQFYVQSNYIKVPEPKYSNQYVDIYIIRWSGFFESIQ